MLHLTAWKSACFSDRCEFIQLENPSESEVCKFMAGIALAPDGCSFRFVAFFYEFFFEFFRYASTFLRAYGNTK